MKDYYDVLRVDRDASPELIKRTYRNLARTYHPDANPDSRIAEETFKEINEAYDVLGNPKKRERYDLELGLARRTASRPATRPAAASATRSPRQGSPKPRSAKSEEPRDGGPDWSSAGGATPMAVFRSGTPLQGLRIMRKGDAIILEGKDEMAAVAVLEFDRLGQLIWRDEGQRTWVASRAAARPKASSRPSASAGSQAHAGPGVNYEQTARASDPPYIDATARALVEKAHRAFAEGKPKQALEHLWYAEPSARLGDSEVARGIVELARLMRETVSAKRKDECDALILRAENALGSIAAESARPVRQAPRVVNKESAIAVSTVIGIIWLVLIIIRLLAAASS